VNYIDYTLVRLADAALRGALFDQVGLEQIARAAYDAETMLLGPPFSAVFDDVSVGLSLAMRTRAEAAWGPTTGGDRREGRVTLLGIGGAGAVRVDALWLGGVVANAVSPLTRIAQVITHYPDTSAIDAAIIAAQGSLPTAPAALEAARRAQLLARLRAGFQQPTALTDAVFDRWLAQIGASSVGDLMARFTNQLVSPTMQVGFTAAGTTTTPRTLPIAAAIVIRDQPVQVAALLADSKLVAEQLEDFGLERARQSDVAPRHPLVVVWMIPETTFDDAGWPGGETATTDAARRLARRQAAGVWLAREGIGLVTTPVVPG
jgi:hypothetical protein